MRTSPPPHNGQCSQPWNNGAPGTLETKLIHNIIIYLSNKYINALLIYTIIYHEQQTNST